MLVLVFVAGMYFGIGLWECITSADELVYGIHQRGWPPLMVVPAILLIVFLWPVLVLGDWEE